MRPAKKISLIDQIHPELREQIQRFPTLPLHNQLFLQLLKLSSRFISASETGPDVAVEVRKLDRTSVRIYRPLSAQPEAGLLWIHGGGYIIGNTALDNRICGAIARDLQVVVVSVEYRLAPKYPFPAAQDDCLEAWHWLLQAASEFGIDTQRIAIGGQSAGAGLAAALVQRVYDGGGTQPAAQVLFCPMIDDRTAARYELDNIAYPLWHNRNNRAGWMWYLGQPAGAPTLPRYAAAARREHLGGLPPAWISVGDIELFYDESCRYAERLSKAGVPTQLHITPGAPHGFEFVVPEATVTRVMFRSAYRFLKNALQLRADAEHCSYGR